MYKNADPKTTGIVPPVVTANPDGNLLVVNANAKQHEEIKRSIKKTYGKRGEAILRQNYAGVDMTLAELFEVDVPGTQAGNVRRVRRFLRRGASGSSVRLFKRAIELSSSPRR